VWLIPAYGKWNPTAHELLKARNMTSRHCQKVGDRWNCPGCRRSYFDITRWHFTEQTWGRTIVIHHDHVQPPRFANIFICEDCNKVDIKIKGVLRQALQLRDGNVDANNPILQFSLSAAEISRVVVPRPHREHAIRYGRALAIVERVTGVARPENVGSVIAARRAKALQKQAGQN
jgi:hypothetical protein